MLVLDPNYNNSISASESVVALVHVQHGVLMDAMKVENGKASASFDDFEGVYRGQCMGGGGKIPF
jgi:hypothetical protein